MQRTRWPGWTVYPSESEQCPGMEKDQQIRPSWKNTFAPVCSRHKAKWGSLPVSLHARSTKWSKAATTNCHRNKTRKEVLRWQKKISNSDYLSLELWNVLRNASQFFFLKNAPVITSSECDCKTLFFTVLFQHGGQLFPRVMMSLVKI